MKHEFYLNKIWGKDLLWCLRGHHFHDINLKAVIFPVWQKSCGPEIQIFKGFKCICLPLTTVLLMLWKTVYEMKKTERSASKIIKNC